MNEGRYICHKCWYEYEGVQVCQESGVLVEIDFIDLPGDWVCPDCGVNKAYFSKCMVDTSGESG